MAVTRMPPGWRYERHRGQVEVTGPPALNVHHQDWEPEPAMGMLSIDQWEQETDGNEAAALLVVHALHEAIEWVQEDGESLACAHPGDRRGGAGVEADMWDFFHAEALRLVKEARRRWPA